MALVESIVRSKDYRLKAGRFMLRLKVERAAEAASKIVPAQSRLKAPGAL